jgi:hypothetical protein
MHTWTVNLFDYLTSPPQSNKICLIPWTNTLELTQMRKSQISILVVIQKKHPRVISPNYGRNSSLYNDRSTSVSKLRWDIWNQLPWLPVCSCTYQYSKTQRRSDYRSITVSFLNEKHPLFKCILGLEWRSDRAHMTHWCVWPTSCLSSGGCIHARCIIHNTRHTKVLHK